MKYSPYSFSKLSTHNQCNRKFKYTYIEKAPKSEKDMTPLLKGGAVHSILEHYPNKSPHKLAEKYQHIANKFLETDIAKEIFFGDSVREYDFGLTKDLKPTKYNDKEALFRGSIDYIFTTDKLNLIDFKTGKAKEQKWQSFDQLMFYAIYFFQKYPNINEINISYVYVEHENYHNSIILERQYLKNYISQLLTLIKNVETDTEFKKNESKLCDWCEFKEYCTKDI